MIPWKPVGTPTCKGHRSRVHMCWAGRDGGVGTRGHNLAGLLALWALEDQIWSAVLPIDMLKLLDLGQTHTIESNTAETLPARCRRASKCRLLHPQRHKVAESLHPPCQGRLTLRLRDPASLQRDFSFLPARLLNTCSSLRPSQGKKRQGLKGHLHYHPLYVYDKNGCALSLRDLVGDPW